MKIGLLIPLLLLSSHYSVLAQSSPEINLANYTGKARLETERMTQILLLDTVRHDSIKIVNEAYYLKVARLKDGLLNANERRLQLIDFENEWKEQLRIQLTATQFSQYFDNRELLKRKLDSLRLIRNN